MKNGQCITTVPKAWLSGRSLTNYDLLEWDWDKTTKKTVTVRAYMYRCQHVYTHTNGTHYQCLLVKGHTEWHTYDGIVTEPK